jgi:putative ABC transport system substrate-binding protein
MRKSLFLLLIIVGLGGGATTDAQQPTKVYRIGILTGVPPTTPEALPLWEAFRQGLSERGWVEGQNVIIEYRRAEGQVERYPSLAADLLGLKVDLIVAVSTLGARAAKQATSAIPIVMVYVGDPVGEGLVASLARPGGNITGLTFIIGPEIVGKYLALLKEAVPKVSRVAVLFHQATRPIFLKEAQAVAQVLAVKLQLLQVRSPNELEGAFAAMSRERANGLLVLPHPFSFAHARRIADLAAKRQLPVVYGFRESVEAGGLMAYAANAPDMFRRAAAYVDKILKGTKPADLPVEQPTKFEFIINLKTAKQIGVTIPQSVLYRADEVLK